MLMVCCTACSSSNTTQPESSNTTQPESSPDPYNITIPSEKSDEYILEPVTDNFSTQSEKLEFTLKHVDNKPYSYDYTYALMRLENGEWKQLTRDIAFYAGSYTVKPKADAIGNPGIKWSVKTSQASTDPLSPGEYCLVKPMDGGTTYIEAYFSIVDP